MLFLFLSVDLYPGDLLSAQEELDKQLELCLHKLCDMKIHTLLEGKKETVFNKNPFLQRENSLSTHYMQSAMLNACLPLILF